MEHLCSCVQLLVAILHSGVVVLDSYGVIPSTILVLALLIVPTALLVRGFAQRLRINTNMVNLFLKKVLPGG